MAREQPGIDGRQTAEAADRGRVPAPYLRGQGDQFFLRVGDPGRATVSWDHLPPRCPHPAYSAPISSSPQPRSLRVEERAQKAVEESQQEDSAVDPVGVGIGEDQEPLEAEGVGAEVLPGTDTEGRRQGAKQRLLRDAPGGGPQRIEWFPLHRQDCLEPAIADAGHCQSGRFPLDNEQFGTGIRAVDLAVEEFDRTTMKGMRHC